MSNPSVVFYNTMRKFLPLSAIVILFLAACSGQKSSVSDEAAANSGALPPEVQRNLDLGRMGDSTSFPFVYTGEGRSNLFEAYTMRFRLEYESPMVPLTNDQIPWINEENYTPLNGVFVRQLHFFAPFAGGFQCVTASLVVNFA